MPVVSLEGRILFVYPEQDHLKLGQGQLIFLLTVVIADQLVGREEHLQVDVHGPRVGGDPGGEHDGGEHPHQVQRVRCLDLGQAL